MKHADSTANISSSKCHSIETKSSISILTANASLQRPHPNRPSLPPKTVQWQRLPRKFLPACTLFASAERHARPPTLIDTSYHASRLASCCITAHMTPRLPSDYRTSAATTDITYLLLVN
ncbi:hypothetical protein M433DRAFT_343590 [Acidomyces richmondensis BFW]|nr:MAG: hypothetical protein FE78DRAFT_354452 [Acidomyces sp. 'richmondensis']KYG43602.1 hypothetical protein M433DRAFT_343590 [Acidomyces richmondensis BFW]